MLIPLQASTNIFCIENVLFIQWHVFGIDDSPDHGPSPSQSASSALDQAWAEFVRSGYHACHAFKVKVVWVFELSSTFSSSKSKLPLSEIAQKNCLRKVSSGSLRACDLENLVRGPQTQPNAFQGHKAGHGPASPAQDNQSPATIDSDMKTNDNTLTVFQPTPKQIYDAFITATYDLFVTSLTSRLRAVPLCANIFVQLESRIYPREKRQDSISDDSDPVSNQPYIIVRSASSVGVEWLPNGKLFIAACPARTSLRPISTCLRRYDWIPWGDCYIAPFGIKVPAGCVRRKRSSHGNKLNSGGIMSSQQEDIISVLERRGIRISTDEEWVSCQFPEEADALPAGFQGRCVMWPCSLIYIYELSSCPSHVGKCTSPQAFADAFATTGIGGSRPTPDLSPNMNSGVSRRAKEKGKDPYVYILENVSGNARSHGMYPTPPDMPRSQFPPQTHRPNAFSAPTPATISSMPAPGDGETPSAAPDMMSSPDPGPDIRLGDDADHDDLFGDLTIEMGAEVLNEDEFGFFDVQRPPTGKSQELLDQEVLGTYQTTVPRHPAPALDYLRDEAPRKNMHSTHHSEQGSNGRQRRDVDRRHAVRLVHQTAGAKDSSRAVVSSQIPTFDMDAKYAVGGLYNAPKPKEHSDDQKQGATVRGIPIITRSSFQHDISDSSSNYTDNDDSDYNDADENDDVDDDSNDHDMEDDDEDDEVNMSNEYEDSDTSMEGLDETISPRDFSGKRTIKAAAMLSVEDLAKARIPMLTCPIRLGPKGDTNRVMTSFSLRPDQYIELAQVVAQQLCYYEDGLPGLPPRRSPNQSAVSQTVEALFDNPVSLDIDSCASVVRNSNQHFDSPFSPSLAAEEISSALSTPDIVVERDGSRMVVSAASLSVWSELGLSPIGGQQDVQCYCFAPDVPAWLHGSKDFLEMLHDTFASLRLGRHELGTVGAANSLRLDGVVGIEAADSFQQFRVNLAKSANNFDKLIRSSDMDLHTDVVILYLVNPAPAEETHVLPALCSVFQRLQLSLEAHDITLVLKILPGSLVAQDNALNIPPPDPLRQLAREMYERVSQANGPPSPLSHLAPSLPSSVPMRLESNPARRPLDADTMLHLAYSWTPASPWLTFALTDALGKVRYSSSYYVPWRPTHSASSVPNANLETPTPSTPIASTPSQPPTPGGPSGSSNTASRSNPWAKDNAMGRFVEAIKDLWSSLDKLFPQPKAGMHKLVVVKDSPPVHAQEVHVWKMLAQSRTNMELIFLILDPECPLMLIEPPKSAGQDKATMGSHNRPDPSGLATSTPDTPSASSLAAGNIGLIHQNLGAPGRDPALDDPSSRLIRVKDEAWAVEAKTIFASTPVGKLEIIPGIGGCGYLVSREPNSAEQPFSASVVSVRVQFAKAGPQGVNMREIINSYRGLAAVSEIAGLNTTLPWHVAMARRARIGLARCM